MMTNSVTQLADTYAAPTVLLHAMIWCHVPCLFCSFKCVKMRENYLMLQTGPRFLTDNKVSVAKVIITG